IVCCAVSSVMLTSCVAFFSDTPTTEIYTLSLHDALPISRLMTHPEGTEGVTDADAKSNALSREVRELRSLLEQERLQRSQLLARSEEHTSELQSRENLVCRLLLEKKKQKE